MVKIAENVVHVDFSQTGFTIFLTEDGKLYGMGTSATGAMQEYDDVTLEQVWNPEHYYIATPKLLMEDVAYASCGRNDVVCLLKDGSVWNWGLVWADHNFYDWSAAEDGKYFLAKPTRVLENAIWVTGGFYNHAALLEDGSVWTWGYNLAGSCGVEEERMVSLPAKVAEGVQMVWANRVAFNSACRQIEDFDDFYYYDHGEERVHQNTILLKDDGTYWCCGVGYGQAHHVNHYYEAQEADMVFSYEFVQTAGKNPESALFRFGNMEGLGYGWLYYTLLEKEGEDYKVCFLECRNENDRNKRFEDIVRDENPDYVFPAVERNYVNRGRLEKIYDYNFLIDLHYGETEYVFTIAAIYEVDGVRMYDSRAYRMPEGGTGYEVDGAFIAELNERNQAAGEHYILYGDNE